MIDALTLITSKLREVTPHAYFEKNTQLDVVYPYLTFDIQNEYLDENMDGVYLDLDLFDHNPSYKNLMALEMEIREYFKGYRELTDQVYFRLNFNRSNTIPTGDDTIKRRNVQFYCKIDWRNL